MSRFPKPWFRKSRGWFVTLDGRQFFLSRDRKAALRRYHEVMRRPRSVLVPSESVAALADQFLEWVKLHRRQRTYEWYRELLERFVRRYPDLEVADLKPYHVQQWIDSYPDLSSGSKRNLCRSIIRCMHWSEEQGFIDRTPLAHFKKPRAGVRQLVISPEDWNGRLPLPARGLVMVDAQV